MNEWINKMQSIHTTGYHSIIEKTGLLTHTTTWMNLKTILLNERHQTQKVIGFLIPSIRNAQVCIDRKYLSSSQGLNEGRMTADESFVVMKCSEIR